MFPVSYLGQSSDMIAATINLNHAATTSAITPAFEAYQEALVSYGAYHRGAGPKARRMTAMMDEAKERLYKFLGTTPERATLLFTHNTSAAINLLARMCNHFGGFDSVLTTDNEHTSNLLSWQMNFNVRFVATDEVGRLDYDDLGRKAHDIIALSGSSNMTGFIPDLMEIRSYNKKALLFVDMAQLAPHRPIRMDDMDIDAVAFSAHKCYAPFGVGVLAVPNWLADANPVDPGGGSILMRSANGLIWAPAQSRHQVGSYNTAGIIGTAAACHWLSNNWSDVRMYEEQIMSEMIERLSQIKNERLKFPIPLFHYQHENRTPIIPFMIDGMHHHLVAAVLDHEHQIEVRSGTICNHTLIAEWAGVTHQQQLEIERKMRNGDLHASYGVVRASFGLCTSKDAAQKLASALQEILHGPNLQYFFDQSTDAYMPK